MNAVIAIAVLVIVAGVFAYKKLPAFKEKVDGLLKKQVSTTVHTEASRSEPPPVQPVPTEVLSMDTKEGWETYRNTLVPSTRAFFPTWEQKLERDKVVVSGPALDRPGFVLSAENGWLVTPQLVDDTPYQFGTGKAGTIRVFGVGGNYVRKVNGQDVFNNAEIPGQAIGTFTIVVQSLDGRVGVQIV